MILLLKKNIEPQHLYVIETALKERNAKYTFTPATDYHVLTVEDGFKNYPKVEFSAFDGVVKSVTTKVDYPRVSLQNANEHRAIQIGQNTTNENRTLIIAGPCAVESEEQYLRIARQVKEAGAHALRGGAFKPRTSPYSFQGMGRTGLEVLKTAKEETGLAIVTEAMDIRELEAVAEVADVIQIGSRNMQNFPLLREVGRLKKTILLKRGMSATLQEWLSAAEYIAEGGNLDIILCERGVRSFDPETRNLLDLGCVPVLKSMTFLPIAVDPSHALGRRDAIEAMSLAAVASGAHVIMIETHDRPEQALSDGVQALSPENLKKLISQMKLLAGALNRELP